MPYISDKRIGFISTRFAGNDGVSLESAKWAQVPWDDLQHESFWYGGRLDRAEDISLCIPEAYFGDPENLWINERLWGRQLHLCSEFIRLNPRFQSQVFSALLAM